MSLVGFTRIGQIELPTISGSHTNLVVHLKYNDFISTTGGASDIVDLLDDGGGDLRFSSDQAGLSQLACEVVEFDKTGTSANLWVNAPSVSTGQVIHIWGDNTGSTQPADTDSFGRNAVWSDYEVVLHMNEVGSSGVFVDSTGNGHATTLTGASLLTSATNPLGGSWADFNRTSYLTLGSSGGILASEQAFTMQVLVNYDASDLNVGVFGNRRNSPDSQWAQMLAGSRVAVKNTAEDIVPGGTQLTGVDYWRVMTASTSALASYTNGSEDGRDSTVTQIPLNTGQDFRVGSYYDNSTIRRLNGRAGEVRIRTSELSSDWLLTEYQNQSSIGAWGITTGVGGGTSDSTFTSSGTSSATVLSTSIVSASFSSKGTSNSIVLSKSIASSEFASLSGSTFNAQSSSLANSSFTSNGIASASINNTIVSNSEFASQGTSSFSVVNGDQIIVNASFSSAGTSLMGVVNNSLLNTSFDMQGTSSVSVLSSSVSNSSFTAMGNSTFTARTESNESFDTYSTTISVKSTIQRVIAKSETKRIRAV